MTSGMQTKGRRCSRWTMNHLLRSPVSPPPRWMRYWLVRLEPPETDPLSLSGRVVAVPVASSAPACQTGAFQWLHVGQAPRRPQLVFQFSCTPCKSDTPLCLCQPLYSSSVAPFV